MTGIFGADTRIPKPANNRSEIFLAALMYCASTFIRTPGDTWIIRDSPASAVGLRHQAVALHSEQKLAVKSCSTGSRQAPCGETRRRTPGPRQRSPEHVGIVPRIVGVYPARCSASNHMLLPVPAHAEARRPSLAVLLNVVDLVRPGPPDRQSPISGRRRVYSCSRPSWLAAPPSAPCGHVGRAMARTKSRGERAPEQERRLAAASRQAVAAPHAWRCC